MVASTGLASPTVHPEECREAIPLRVTGGAPLLVVEASINGRGPYNMMVDTGASMTVVSRRTARNARVTRQGSPGAYAIGTGGRAEVEVGRIEELLVGTIHIRDLDVAIMTLPGLSRALGLRLDGALGYNALKTFRLTIDYPSSSMLLDQSATQA